MMGAGAGAGSRQGLAFSQVCLHTTAVSPQVTIMLPYVLLGPISLPAGTM